MSIDTRTPQERAYDALKDGSAYFSAAPVDRAAIIREFDQALDAEYDQAIAELEAIEQRHGITDGATLQPAALAEIKAWIDQRFAKQVAIAEEAERTLNAIYNPVYAVRQHGRGYQVVRAVDGTVITTCATAGQAAQLIHALEDERHYWVNRTAREILADCQEPAA